MVFVLRITNEGYILIDEARREEILQELVERWDHLFEEARWGSIERAMEMYDQLFEWLDTLGKRVRQYDHHAHAVLPPRDLEADELKSLLGRYKR